MKTCGECFFARAHADPRMIECGGVPPTPVFFGMQPAKVPLLGKNGIGFTDSQTPVLKCIAPPLPKSYPACALFRPLSLESIADDVDPLPADRARSVS